MGIIFPGAIVTRENDRIVAAELGVDLISREAVLTLQWFHDGQFTHVSTVSLTTEEADEILERAPVGSTLGEFLLEVLLELLLARGIVPAGSVFD